MAKLSKQFVIDAPADAVWQVVGPGFDGIGDWATAIPASRAAPGPEGQGRVCTTGMRAIPEITELMVGYDDARRSLTYRITGLPRFIAVAQDSWSVTPLPADRCLLRVETRIDTRGVLGTLARWPLLAGIARSARHLGTDLGHFVLHGTPSPRKQRQLSRAEPVSRAGQRNHDAAATWPQSSQSGTARWFPS